MRIIFIILFQVLLISTALSQAKPVYTCPMHPEITQEKSNKCPKCGMDLVKKTLKADKPQKARPAEESRNNPPAKPATAPRDTVKPSPQNQAIFTCPMHSEVVDTKPGKCPECGMTLTRKEGTGTIKDSVTNEHEHANMHDHSQPGTEPAGTIPFCPGTVKVAPGKTVVQHLYVTDTLVNFTGRTRHAYAINGTIPGPELVFTEGDTAEIYLHNLLKKEETSLHWHGVILPNRFDGVPYLTTRRIGPGETYLYKFAVVQNGTYWYHSHTSLQEQGGMYGALIFKKRPAEHVGPTPASRHHQTIVLSEWTDDKPTQVQRRLRTANDWFAIRKGSTQSYSEAIRAGAFNTKLINEWKRMKAMDVSDVFYDRFLVNGKPEDSLPGFKPGDRVNLHVVNAGASSYFWLQYSGGKLTVTGTDGNDLVPVEVDRLIIAPAETVDLVVTIGRSGSYEFRATAEDRTGASSLWLGAGTKKPAPHLPRLEYFEGMKMMNSMMKTDGTMNDMGMNMSLQQMDMNSVMYPEIPGTTVPAVSNDSTGMDHKPSMPVDSLNAADTITNSSVKTHDHNDPGPGSGITTLNYAMMRSPVNTALPDGPFKTLHFELTGNMNRYVWTLGNKTVNEADRILIYKGENLRIILTNSSMMRHPMHLHGHDFRVINGQGDYAPLKNVLDIMPMETDTIEFAANQDGDWFFHCHILYHMMAGMGRVFSYANSAPNPDLPDPKKADRMFKMDNSMRHLMARVGLETNGSDGELMWSSNRYALQGLWHLGTKPHHGYETEIAFGRYLDVNQWLFPYVGFDYHYNSEKYEMKEESNEYKNMFGQVSNKNNRKTFTVGLQYTTPWLMLADARVDGDGKFRIQLSREDIPITPRLRFAVMANTDKEYMAGFRYIVSKWFALSTHYDTDMGIGVGVTLNY